MRNISKFQFEFYKIFGEDMAALTLAPTKIRWDELTNVGACLLELACVFEEFRSISHETYGLGCAYHFSASNLAGDGFKWVCKADVELLTDRDYLGMVEKMMRGGTASIFEKRQFTSNNSQLNEKFNASEDTTYGFMVDANNLYGGVMQNHKLPARHFETIGVRNKLKIIKKIQIVYHGCPFVIRPRNAPLCFDKRPAPICL